MANKCNGTQTQSNGNPDSRKGVPESEPEEDNTSSCDVSPPVPPDGGYGWVIMFASFICNVIVDGVCFSVGIFYLEFLKFFQESKSKTSLVGSVLNGMYLSMGPIVSALANRFGCRAVTIAGSLVACTAYVLAVFSPNIDILILTYGGLGGAGFGLMYLPAIVMVGYYFEKRRAFATGVAVCGSGIGAFVFAPLTERLLSYYGWKGATLIVGGIALNGVVMGSLFRPLEASCKNKKRPQKKLVTRDQTKSNIVINKPDVYVLNVDEVNLDEEGDAGKQKLIPETPVVQLNGNLEPRDLIRSKMAVSIERTLNEKRKFSDNGRLERQYLQSMNDLCLRDSSSGRAYSRQFSKSVDNLYIDAKAREDLAQRARDISRPMYRKDIFYSGSIMHLPEYQARQDESYTKSITSIPRSTLGRGDNKQSRSMCASMTDTLGEMMDFSLMLNPVFALYGMSCFLCMTGFFVPFMYLPDDAILKGVPRENAAFLLSIIGIANTIARVLCGWVSDRPWADCLLINNFALIIGGVATILSPFCINYAMLATYAAVFGSAIAVFVSLRSILMVELIGLDKLTNAFGLVTLCQGLSSFIGAPIAGAIFDATGNYAVSFYFAGSTLLLAGLICLPLRRIAAWQKRREEAKKDTPLVPLESSSSKE